MKIEKKGKGSKKERKEGKQIVKGDKDKKKNAK